MKHDCSTHSISSNGSRGSNKQKFIPRTSQQRFIRSDESPKPGKSTTSIKLAEVRRSIKKPLNSHRGVHNT
jgi:hypothetical protein